MNLYFSFVNNTDRENWFFVYREEDKKFIKNNLNLKLLSIDELKKDLDNNKNHHLYIDYTDLTDEEIKFLENKGIKISKKF